MGEWQEYKLGDLAKVKGGKRLPLGKNLTEQPTSHPYIRTRDINNNKIAVADLLYVPEDVFNFISRYIVEKDDVIISIVGTIGLCAIVPSELHLASLTENCVKIVDINKSKLDSKFLFYFLISDIGQEEIEKRNVGSTQPKLPLYNINDIPIPTPVLSEQRAIASILSCLDDKIDLLHRQNKTLEALAETLFRQWFVEEVDESWEETIISDVASHIKDSVNPSKNPLEIYYHYSLPAFDDGREPKIEIGNSILSNKYKVPSDCILVSKLNPRVSRIWGLYGKIDELKSICSTEFQIVKPKEKLWYSFIYYFLKSNPVTNELAGASGGTSGSHQRVDPKVIFDLTFLKPDSITLKKFHNITSNYWYKIKENKFQIRTLTQLRDTLLPKLMSGEIRLNLDLQDLKD